MGTCDACDGVPHPLPPTTNTRYERLRVGRRLMTTSTDRDGIYYAVYEGTEATAEAMIWHRYVRFGKSKRNYAGGKAFVEAAREQERVAKRGEV